ncbi:MAG: hypothetical protein QNJ54_23870 [Prochloraceae cyanobacterium]|nr:hypothetical protein [Prochloraceae cyanobacterium]
MAIDLSNYENIGDAVQILEQSEKVSTLVRDGLESTWNSIFTSVFYKNVAHIGAIFAILLIGFAGVQYLRYLTSPNQSVPTFKALVLPILVLILLGTPADRGVLFGEVTLGLYHIQNGISELILVAMSDEFKGKIISEAGTKSAVQMIASQAIKNCSVIQEQKKRNNCLSGALDQIETLLKPYYSNPPPPFGKPGWARTLYNNMRLKIQKVKGGIHFSDIFRWSFIGDSVNNIFQAGTMGSLLAVGFTFQVLLEIISLAIASFGPLYLGLSLFPLGNNPPIFDWLGQLYSIGLIKLYYAIIIAFSAQIAIVTPFIIPQFFPLMAGLFAPVAAVVIVMKGGLGLLTLPGEIAVFLLQVKR